MLTDIPQHADYQKVGIECLVQAYKSIFYVDTYQQRESVSREDTWKYQAIVLRTSIVLIHQGIESLMKSEVAKVSPLLLLEQKKSEWKTLPKSTDESFADLYTISGMDLLRAFYASVGSGTISDDFVQHFETVRIERNRIVHGLGNKTIQPESVLKWILWSFTYLLGKDSFWQSLMDNFFDHPGYLAGDPDLEQEEIQQYIHLDYLGAILGNGELNHHFTVDFKARKYFCPDCTLRDGIVVYDDGTVNENPASKWAFLEPNTPQSTVLRCLVCSQKFEVERVDCAPTEGDACKGNVIYTDEESEKDEDTGEMLEPAVKTCMTCMKDQRINE